MGIVRLATFWVLPAARFLAAKWIAADRAAANQLGPQKTLSAMRRASFAFARQTFPQWYRVPQGGGVNLVLQRLVNGLRAMANN